MEKMITEPASSSDAMDLRARCIRHFEYLGLNTREAEDTYLSLIYAESRQIKSHGLNRIFSGFIKSCIKKAMMEPNKEPRLLPESDRQRLFFDGNFSIGYYGIKRVVDSVIDRMTNNTVVFAHVKNLYPTNVLAEYAEMLCDAGCTCFITSKSPAKVTPPVDFDRAISSVRPTVGTNAYAWGFPRIGAAHAIFDVSMAGATNGELLQPREVLRKSFQPSNFLTREMVAPADPDELFDQSGTFNGSILPFGGARNHKGFGNLLVAELFNLFQHDNTTATSTTIIAVKSDDLALSNQGQAFREFCEGGVTYRDGSSARLPHSDRAVISEADVLSAYETQVQALKTNVTSPALPSRIDSDARTQPTHAFKTELVTDVGDRIIAEFGDAFSDAIGDAVRVSLSDDDFFQQWAKDYNLPNLQTHANLLTSLLATTSFDTSDTVLDIGCGDGGLLTYLPKVASVTGIDISREMLDKYDRKHANEPQDYELVCTDILDYRPGKTFDKAIAVMSLHHLGHADKLDALKHLSSLLSESGTLLIGETFLDSENLSDPINLRNIAEIYYRKIRNCFTHGVVSHGLKDFQILRRILHADGEYMLTRKAWFNLLESAGFLIEKSELTTPEIGYGYIFAKQK